VRLVARVGARARQAPESRCSRSPLGAVQEGRQQALDRPFQWRRNQSVWYLPDNILAWMVAARTVEEEEPQVSHRGWAPRPRGRKAVRRCVGNFYWKDNEP